MIERRRFIAALAALQASAASPLLRAQAGGATRILVGFPPGGVVDVTARALAEALRPSLSGPVVVDNRVGAGGTIAIEAAKSSTPDGSTLLYSPPSMFTVIPHVDPRIRYDAFADFIPVSTVCAFPFALAIAPNLPARNLAEFIAWAKANPKDAAFGSPGIGTIQNFVGVMLGRASGAELTHVPYKGGAQSIIDVMAGTLAASVSVAQLFTANHKAGKLRVIATTGERRLASLGDVPTFAEQGYPNLTFEEWFGVFLPARTASDTVARHAKGIAAAVASPAMQEALKRLDYEPYVRGPDEFAQLLRTQHARWRGIVKETGFRPS